MKTDIRTKLVRREDQSVGTWSGGTTTQLAIWPPEADYERRDFVWRISTARVDSEESSFTPLPGFHRILTILEGGVRLVYEAQDLRRERDLRPFEQDEFEGAWNTVSRGRCVDFNLMTAPGCAGRVEALRSDRKTAALRLFADIPGLQAGLQPVLQEEGTPLVAVEAFYCLEPLRVNEFESEFECELERGDFLTFRQKFPWKTIEASFERADALRENGESSVWGIRTTAVSR
jgi:environmental stress-induced protein Ves